MKNHTEIKPGFQRTDVGVIPKDWECAPLDDFISFISYGFTNPMPTACSGVFMITAADVAEGRINYETARYTTLQAYERLLTPKSKPKKDDILLTKDGALGRVAIVGDESICINQSVAVLRSNEKAASEFLGVLLQAGPYQRKMIEDAGGSTIKHIYITIVNLMPIAVPRSIVEQRAIATALSDADALIASLDALIAKKRDLKQAAMQQLLTGKTRLPGFTGEWEVKRLDAVCSMKSGEQITTAKIDSHSAFRCFGGNGLRGLATRYNHDGRYCLIGRQGALCGNVVEVEGRFFASEHAIVVTPFQQTDISWLTFVLERMKLNQYSESSAQPGLSVVKLLALELNVPTTKAEQSAIAAVLLDMDADLAALEAQRDKARALKQGMMQELLTGRIRLI